MFTNHIKIAFRNMRKNKLDTILNLSGLSLGLALGVLILFHIQDELSFDRHFPKADRIFRISCEMREGNNVRHWATTSPVLPEHMTPAIPEIEKTCRLFVIGSQILSYLPDNDAPRRFKEASGFFADQNCIDVFDFNFIKGNPKTALSEVNSIVLSEATAEKFFPEENPLGKMISLSNGDKSENLLKVTGVVQNLPSNTHFDFAYLVSFPTFYVFLRDIGQEQLGQAKSWAALYNYVLLKDKNLIRSAEAKLPDFVVDYFSGLGSREEILDRAGFHFQPITDIHLHSKLEQEFKANSDIAYVYIFSAIAFLIMLVVAVNFINIAMAQALKRMREVGIRKAMGVGKLQLIGQIIGESLLPIFIASGISLFLIRLLLPFYNALAGKNYLLGDILQRTNMLFFFGIILSFGFLASLYPAIFLSGFSPTQSLKGIRDPLSAAARARKGLVIFQFTISIFMIFGTIVTFQQLEYFNHKNLGFDKENVIAIQLNNDLQQLAIQNPMTLKNELLKNSAVLAASIVSDIPGDRLSVEPLRVVGAPDIDAREQFRFIRVDKDYPQVLNLKLTNGRDFSTVTENTTAFIINEKAAQALQLPDPVGRMASGVFGTQGEIVGVVSDFNFASLHNHIEPLVIEHFPLSHQLRQAVTAYLLVKIQGSAIQASLQSIQASLNKIAPGSLFNYSFLDQDLSQLYASEQRLSDLFKAFALFAIFISCLGLFGLSSYSAQLRVKEIGIRKTLGASLLSLVQLLSKKYVIWILIANGIALPLGWIYVSNWLNNFAYRTPIGSLPFIITILLSIGLAFIAVSYHAFKAALANPVEALRFE
ncbi:ABC transporter permease [candidate division KSB1 bacterium]|nr:ABC transporter permease [candidate division KSB1 bacterium]